MAKRKEKMEIIQENTQKAINEVNKKIVELGSYSEELYFELCMISTVFDMIRHLPGEQTDKYQELKKINLNWREQAKKIQKDYDEASIKGTGAGVAGAGVGVAVAAFGPTAAMGIATTFGVASTGTAIATLHGAAATNAALAWLGGGALAAGGGGIAAGEAFLALAGPIGWAIGGIALISSGAFLWNTKKSKEIVENIFTLISERDINSYKLAITEMNERIVRMKDEKQRIHSAIEKIKQFDADYNYMSDMQKYELGSYVNLMNSSTQLLTNPVMGLLPKYTEEDYKKYVDRSDKDQSGSVYSDTIVFFANLLYEIDINDKEKKVIWKTFRKNKKMLNSFGISKKEFDYSLFETIFDALEYKYAC